MTPVEGNIARPSETRRIGGVLLSRTLSFRDPVLVTPSANRVQSVLFPLRPFSPPPFPAPAQTRHDPALTHFSPKNLLFSDISVFPSPSNSRFLIYVTPFKASDCLKGSFVTRPLGEDSRAFPPFCLSLLSHSPRGGSRASRPPGLFPGHRRVRKPYCRKPPQNASHPSERREKSIPGWGDPHHFCASPFQGGSLQR